MRPPSHAVQLRVMVSAIASAISTISTGVTNRSQAVFTGFSGFRLGGRWKHPVVTAKRRRMPVIALNGLLVLVPCAFVLRHFAIDGALGTTFYAVQALELCAGALNIALISLNFRDGLRLRRKGRAAETLTPEGCGPHRDQRSSQRLRRP